MPVLRPYQIEALDSIMKAWEHCNRVLLQMPTGLGKTTVFSEIVKDFIFNKHPNKRVLILVHRIELLDQVKDRLVEFGIRATSITSSEDFDQNHQVSVATIQTLIKRLDTISNFSLIVVDEAHHSTSPSYLRVFEHYTSDSLKILGVTATPQRLDGQGFDQIYDLLIPSGQIREYIPKYLCDVTQRASSYPDFSTIKVDPTTRDYELESSKVIMSNSKVMADLVMSFKEYCLGKKTLIFAVNSAHSQDIVNRLQKESIKIQHIDYKTPSGNRRKIIQNFKEGKLDAICNVEIFTEGFDCPEVDVVVMARPTKSLALYLQQAGRCLRPKSDGRKGLILDHAKLWLEHGLIKENRRWSLAGTKEIQGSGNSKNRLRNIIRSNSIELPYEVEKMIMEEFQLEETKEEVIYYNGKIEIDSDWWHSLHPELQEILKNSAPISIDNNDEISEIDLQAIWNLDTVDLQNRTIKSSLLPLSRLKNIKRAECSMLNYHSIKTFSKWEGLEYLDLSFSSIERLNPIFTLDSLITLNISNTQIDSINPIRSHSSLQDLNLSFSNVQKIGLIERFPDLERLSLAGLNVKDLSFLRNNKKLKELNISHTGISNISFLDYTSSLKKLIVHDCLNLKFDSIDLTQLKVLDISYSSFNTLRHLTKGSRNVNLEWLNISGCQLRAMEELLYCEQLKTLIVDDIDIDQDLIGKLLMKFITLTIYRNGESMTYINYHLG